MPSTNSQGRRPQTSRSATAPAGLPRFVAHENATPPALRHLTPERPVTTIRESKSVVVLPAHVEVDAEHGPRNIVNLSLGPPSNAASAPSQRVQSRASTNHSVSRPSSRAARASTPTALNTTPQYTSSSNAPRNYSYPSIAGVLRDPRPCPPGLNTAANRVVGPVVSWSTSYQQTTDFEPLTYTPDAAATARYSNHRSNSAILEEGAVAPGSPLSRISPGTRNVAHHGSSSGSERVLYYHKGALTKSSSNIAPKVRSQAASLVGSSPTQSVHMADRYPSPLKRRNVSEPILPILVDAQPQQQPRTLMDMRPQHERAPSFRPPPALVDWENDYSRDSVGYTLPEIRERRARLSKHFPQPENAALTEGRQRRFAGDFRDVPRVITGEIQASRAPEWGSAADPVVEVEAHKEGAWRKISGAVAKRFGKKGKDPTETTRSSSDSGPAVGNASSPAKSPRTSDGTSVDAAPLTRKERRARRSEAEHGWQPTAVGTTMFGTQGLSRPQKNPVKQPSPKQPAQVQRAEDYFWQRPQTTAAVPAPVQRVSKYSRHQPITTNPTSHAEGSPRLYMRAPRSTAAAAALTRIQEDDGDDDKDDEPVLAKLMASGRVSAERIAAFKRQQRALAPNDPEREALENLYGPPDGVSQPAEAAKSLPVDGDQALAPVGSAPNEGHEDAAHGRAESVSPLTDRERELLEQVYGPMTTVSPLSNSSTSLSVNESRAPAVVVSDPIRPQHSVSPLNQQERLQQLFRLREPVSPLTNSTTSLSSIEERLAAAPSADMHSEQCTEEREEEYASPSGEAAPKPDAGTGPSEPQKEQEQDERVAPATYKPTKYEDWDKFDFDLHPPPLVIHKHREPSPDLRPVSMVSDESLDEVEATAVRFASVGKARLEEIGRPAVMGKGKSRQVVLDAPVPSSQEAVRVGADMMRNDSFEAKKAE